MPRLSFKLGFRSTEMNALDLPVEIRKPNSVLVARARSSQTIDLPAGEYYVTTRLPAGQQITRSADLRAVEAHELALEPDPEDAWDHEWDEERHFLDRARPPRQRGEGERASLRAAAAVIPADLALEASADAPAPQAAGVTGQAAPSDGPPSLRVFSGNLLQDQRQLEPPEAVLQLQQFEAGSIVYFKVQAPRLVVVQLLEAGAPALNLVVPPEARLAVSRRPTMESGTTGVYKMEAFTRNSVANLQLRYCRQGAYQRAADAAASERLLHDKIEDPVAAAVGAYSLLRIGDLDRLHEWTENLRQWFGWLPDGSAIRGEHLARLGRHADALAAFAELPARGLPVVADGLVYTYERVKLYSRLTPDQSAGVDTGLARGLFAKIERFASLVHRQRALTSFPGVDPAQPSFSPIPSGPRLEKALELHWLRAPAPRARATGQAEASASST